jgi:hypothetical protein
MSLVPMLQRCGSVYDVKQRFRVNGQVSISARGAKVQIRGVMDHRLAQVLQVLDAKQ